MITIHSDSSIHKRLITTYPNLETLAKEFKPKFGRVQDFTYIQDGEYLSWTEVLKWQMKNVNEAGPTTASSSNSLK